MSSLALATALVLASAGGAGGRPGGDSTSCDPRTHAHSDTPLGSIAVYVPTIGGTAPDPGLSARLETELDELGGFRVIGEAEAERELDPLGLAPRACGGEWGCLGVVARALRARYVLVGEPLADAGGRQLLASLVDASTLRPVARVVEDLPTDPLAEAQALRRLAVRLLAPDGYVGALDIEAVGDGAVVLLDGRKIGATPLTERLLGLGAGPHRLTVRSPSGPIEQLIEVPFHGDGHVRIDAGRDRVTIEEPRPVPPDAAGALDLSSLEPGIEVRVDGDPVAITSAVTPLVPAAAGNRHLGFRKAGQPESRLELQVAPRTLTPVRVVPRRDGGTADALQARPMRDGRSSPAAPSDELSDRIVSLTSGDGPGPPPLPSHGSMAQAVALAAYGYLATALNRLDTAPRARTSARALMVARRAQEGIVVRGSRSRLSASPWEWAAVGGGSALIAGGLALVAHELFFGSRHDGPDGSPNPVVLLSAFNVSFNGETGFLRFRTRF